MTSTPEPQLRDIPLDRIVPDPNQPRTDFDGVEKLAQSMREYGQLYPIQVTRLPDDRFMIVDGESRYRGAQKLNWSTMKCIVVEIAEQSRLAIQMVANVLRSDLNPFERAELYHELIHTHGWTQKDIAGRDGSKPSRISSILRLRSLPGEIRDRLRPVLATASWDSLFNVARATSTEERNRLVDLILSGANVQEVRAGREKKTSKTKKTNAERTPKAPEKTVAKIKKAPEAPPIDPESISKPTPAAAPPTDDEIIIQHWWEAYTIHAVRASDISHILPDSLEMSTKKLSLWIEGHHDQIIGDRRVVSVFLAPGKVVHQLIPIDLDRPDYQRDLQSRLADHKSKTK